MQVHRSFSKDYQRRVPSLDGFLLRKTEWFQNPSDRLLARCLVAGVPLVACLTVLAIGRPSHDSFFWLGLTLFICLTALVIEGVFGLGRHGDAAGFFFVLAFLIWYAYPLMVSLAGLGAETPTESPENVGPFILALTCIALFLLSGMGAMFVVDVMLNLRRRRWVRPRRTCRKRLLGLALCACLVGLLPYFLYGESVASVVKAVLGGRSVVKPWIQVSRFGNEASALGYLCSSGLVAGTALLWSILEEKKLRITTRTGILIIALFTTALVYLDFGTRSIVALVIIPPCGLWLMKIWRTHKVKAIRIGVSATFFIILLVQFQVLFRTERTRDSISTEIWADWLTLRGTIDYFRETVFVVRLVPEMVPYQNENILKTFLVSPIPRFLWPNKPVSGTVWLYSLFRWNIDIDKSGGNMLPGIVGQWYMSWGWLGAVFGGALLGSIVRIFDRFGLRAWRRRKRYETLVILSFGVWVFLSFRLLSPGFLYPVIFLGGIVYISQKKRVLCESAKISESTIQD